MSSLARVPSAVATSSQGNILRRRTGPFTKAVSDYGTRVNWFKTNITAANR